MLAHLLGFLLLGLHFAYFANGAFYLCIALVDDILCLGACLLDDGPMFLLEGIDACVEVGDDGVEAFLLLVYVVTLVFPVFAVAHDVEQILVHVDVVAAHNLARLVDDLCRQTRLAGNLDGKRTAGIADGQLEEGLHELPIVEHGAIDNARSLVGKLLEVLVVRGNDAHDPLVVELLEDGLCDGGTDLGFGSAAKLVDEHE